jgi:mRNA-degrading endonuclease HigB of HigAB toxin-antitoxin module
MKKNPTAEELLKELENRLSKGDFKDSVHQIKLMTTRDMILEMISK